MVPLARIERATSPLPRECSTTELQRRYFQTNPKFAARAPLHPVPRATFGHLERVKGIEPSSSAWKASALPLSYTRVPLSLSAKPRLSLNTPFEHTKRWWRRLDSNQRRRKPTDLQSAPFNHSGTPPAKPLIMKSFGGHVKPDDQPPIKPVAAHQHGQGT